MKLTKNKIIILISAIIILLFSYKLRKEQITRYEEKLHFKDYVIQLEYPLEEHNIITDDLYVLKFFRI